MTLRSGSMKDIYADEEAFAVAYSHYQKGKDLLQRRPTVTFAQDALDEFETAANMGLVRAMYYAGAIHDNPMLDANCTDAEGYVWLVKAAEFGEPGAAELLHDHYSRGMYRLENKSAKLSILGILSGYGYPDVRRDIQCLLEERSGECHVNGGTANTHLEQRVR